MFPFQRLEQDGHGLLTSEQPQWSSDGDDRSREAVLNLAVDFLRRTDQELLSDRLQHKAAASLSSHDLKTHLQQRLTQALDSAHLQQIHTELHITAGGASEGHQEHELRWLEIMSRKPAGSAITSEELFNHRPQPIRAETRGGATEEPIRAETRGGATEEPIRAETKGGARVVLTVGVAGVGKTVLTQRLSLDWAEGRALEGVQMIFPFTFTEFNVLKDQSFSLVDLILHNFSQTKPLLGFSDLRLIFILDGLDQSRLVLDFVGTRVLTDPTESASVEELLVNLIRGDLLPSAQLWITSRPAGANQIPSEYVSMVTEARGFTDFQREQFFRTRFLKNKQLCTVSRDDVTLIISHIKRIRHLDLLSRVPAFCSILAVALQNFLHNLKPSFPRTLTQIYLNFLVIQTRIKDIKYHDYLGSNLSWHKKTREMVRSLGKLAFEQLQKGNQIFYESDLSKCGLDAEKIHCYFGIFTQVFREEPGLYQTKVYSFIHLSVQEFLAALHVHEAFFSSGKNLLSPAQFSESAESFYRSAVDQALQSPNRHLDLFLQFLLGLSVCINQLPPGGLLSYWTSPFIAAYIKEKLNDESLSAEKSLTLLHCLMELDDHSLLQQTQKNISEGRLSHRYMPPGQWSALVFLLLSSDSDLEVFDLQNYYSSDKVFLRLLSVCKVSNKALLQSCNLSETICAPLASALSSSNLTVLDLSNNDLRDSGVEQLCEGLKSAPSRLHTLRLSGCLVSERGGTSLASAVSSAHSQLRQLDLSYNDPGASAELLRALRAPHGPLASLRLEPCGARWMTPGLHKYYIALILDQDTVNDHLQLSDDGRTVTSVREKQLRPHHPDRFEFPQVLSSTALSGCCYYEVQWSGGFVDIALSYRGIRRRGERRECEFGSDHQSWSLRTTVDGFSVCHNSEETALFSKATSASAPASVNPLRVPSIHRPSYTNTSAPNPAVLSSGRVGVLLCGDSLSFFDLSSGTRVLLHTFSTVFTQPLFAGFWLLNSGSAVTLLEPVQ